MRINPFSLNNPIPFKKKDVVVIKTTPRTECVNPDGCQPLGSGTKVIMTKYDEEGNVSSVVEATRIDYFA